MFPAKFGWNWPSGSWEDFLNIFPYILLCKRLSPWSGATHAPIDFIWTTLNLLAPRMLHGKYQCIPAGGSWEETFSRFIKIVLTLPLIGPHPRACFLPSLVEIGLVVLEKSFKGKSRRRPDGRTLRHTISSHGLRRGELKIKCLEKTYSNS